MTREIGFDGEGVADARSGAYQGAGRVVELLT